ncbi:hypothetical protein [Nocardioides sp.]|jgi:hypothetical protein|uniref:hypothetical protein n=1 Tax=Nocardioides sp. TaxID=35761 RepID=UPI002B78EA15|nr:hypothetical protein [Nocardioides sp.]HVX55093.1 hypothetical protein [Nocardioides sp.]
MRHRGPGQVYRGVVSLALLGGLLAGGSDPLGGLLGLLGGGSTTPAATVQPSGQLSMGNQVLRKGCSAYSYGYSITVPPGDDWDLETFLTDKHGTSQGSDVILSGADPTTGTKHMTLCRPSSPAGTFTLHGTLYTSDGVDPTTTTVLAPVTVKLAKPHHHKKHHHKHHAKKRR